VPYESRIYERGCHSSRRFAWINWALAVAAVLVMSAGGFGLFRLWDLRYNSTEQIEAVLKIGVADHVYCVIDSNITRLVFTPEQMALSIGKEYIGLVSILERTLARDFQVPVAHRCTVNGREYFHLVIKKREQVISLIISRKKGEEYPPQPSSNRAEVLGIPLYQARLRGLDVVGFETSDHLVFVVSAEGSQETLQIAEEITVPICEFLSKLELRSGLGPEEF
jgi:hypothetical protein